MKSERDILLLSLFTFLTVMSWITFEFLKTAKTSTVTTTTQQLLSPLNPTIDMDTLNVLKTKK